MGGGSYPLRKSTKDPHGTVTAWGSDELILCENGNGIQNPARDIVVAREVAVESEAGSVKEQTGWTASAEAGWSKAPRSRGS